MSNTAQQTVIIQEAPGTSGLAIAGLIFAIFGWFTCGLLCIPGALLCLLALFSRGPKGAAIAGLIVGFPGTLFFGFMGLGLIMGALGLGEAISDAGRAAEELQTQHDAMMNASPDGNLDESSVSDAPTQASEQLSITDVDGSDDPPTSSLDVEGADLNLRTWTDSGGSILAEAKYVQSDKSSVTLQKADGEQITVSLDELSQTSQDLVHSIRPSLTDTKLQANPEENADVESQTDRTDPRELFNLSMQQKLEEERRVEEEQRKVSEGANWRTWTTADGRFSVEAQFVKFIGGTLTLKKRDGTEISVNLEILSKEDQEFIRQRGRQ